MFCQGREEAIVFSQIEEEQKQAELRRAQAALLEKQEKNNKKKENEEFLDSLVTNIAETFYNQLFAYCRFLIELVTLFERQSNVPVIGKVLALYSSFIDLVPSKVSSKLHVVCYFFTANCVRKNPLDKISARGMKH